MQILSKIQLEIWILEEKPFSQKTFRGGATSKPSPPGGSKSIKIFLTLHGTCMQILNPICKKLENPNITTTKNN